MRLTSFLIVLILPVGVGGLAAEEALTEEAFLAAVDEAHPASRALTGDLGVAEAERLQAWLFEEPRLEVTREEPDEVARETTWGVAWTPPIDGRRRWAVRAAEAGVETERHVLEWRLSRQRLEVRTAYAAWVGSQARAALMAGHGRRLEVLAERMRNRAEAGEVSNLEARRLELAFQASEAGLARARAAEGSSRARAAAWVGGAWDLSAMRPVLPELPDVPEGLDSGVGWAQRPDLRAARSRVVQAESLERLSKRVAEAPELLLGWRQIEIPGSDLEGPVFAIGWTVPVFDRRRGDRMGAESSLATALAREEWTKQQARSELIAVLAAYDEFREAALAAQSDLEDLEGVARAAAAAFEQGETGVTDLLDTLQSILDARLAGLDLYLAALDAHRRLERAAGRALTSGDLS